MRPVTHFLTQVGDLVRNLQEQATEIESAAEACARRIADQRPVAVFGAGHSRMACEEAYPRIGGIVGFRPIVESSLTNFATVFGPNGLRQAMFLERIEGFGRLIFDNTGQGTGDVVVVASSSGIETTILEFATTARERGCTVIAITGIANSREAARRRGAGQILADHADHVLDTGIPVGDAAIEIAGMDEAVGATSSILALSLVNALTVATAAQLVQLDVEPMAFASPHVAGDEKTRKRFDECLAAYEVMVSGISTFSSDGLS